MYSSWYICAYYVGWQLVGCSKHVQATNRNKLKVNSAS
jgi:hypothetical protein